MKTRILLAGLIGVIWLVSLPDAIFPGGLSPEPMAPGPVPPAGTGAMPTAGRLAGTRYGWADFDEEVAQ